MVKWATLCIAFLLLALTSYRCFWNLEKAPLERWDETTNISVITETLSRGSFPVLYLSDKPFFEKPPVWYYIHLLVAGVADASPIAMRMTSAVGGFLIILLTVSFAWKWWGSLAGVITWIILLATNHLFVTNPSGVFSTHNFRTADVDSLFILFLVATIFTKNPTLQGIFTGLAVLTKGPLGLLPLLVLSIQRKTIMKSWTIAILFILPWYAFMSILFGLPFLSEHFGYHTLARTLLSVEGHNNPMWYYGALLSNRTFFPSWELLVFSIVWIFVDRKLRRDASAVSVALLATAFFLVPTLAQTRLAWYILPMYPFAAITMGAAVSSVLAKLQKISD